MCERGHKEYHAFGMRSKEDEGKEGLKLEEEEEEERDQVLKNTPEYLLQRGT